MARISFDEVENYRGEGGNLDFFKLKNHQDVKRVRFMYEKEEDIVAYVVHRVEINGKSRNVECIRSYDEPMSKCPLCESGSPQLIKFYIPLYDIDAKKAVIWERGKTFQKKLTSLTRRYNPLVAQVIEIERNGEAGDQKTTYETFVVTEEGEDSVRLKDLPPVPEPEAILLSKNAEEMRKFIATGVFPSDGYGEDEKDDETTGVHRATSRRRTRVDRDDF